MPQEQKDNTLLPVVYKFYSNTCAACKTYDTFFNEVKNELQDKAKFVSVNAPEDKQGLVIEHNIKRLPTTIVIHPNGAIRKKIGIITKDLLKKFILN